MSNRIVSIINGIVIIIDGYYAETWKDGICIGAGNVGRNITPQEVYDLQFNTITFE